MEFGKTDPSGFLGHPPPKIVVATGFADNEPKPEATIIMEDTTFRAEVYRALATRGYVIREEGPARRRFSQDAMQPYRVLISDQRSTLLYLMKVLKSNPVLVGLVTAVSARWGTDIEAALEKVENEGAYLLYFGEEENPLEFT